MRLLRRNGDGTVTLTSDLPEDTLPVFTILSHTWGRPENEVSLADLIEGIATNKPGYQKILFCCEQAMEAGCIYSWIDTCCINKKNEPEVTEAINSMFRWYSQAARCFVYLSDVSTTDAESLDWEEQFRKSRWFRRGWTLQELIAPRTVQFFSKEGTLLGDKRSLEDMITDITGIDIKALRGADLSTFSVDERLSWAQGRRTTRREDQAYCLLGLFNIFMPLLYGEREHALIRLRETIAARTKTGLSFRVSNLSGELPPGPRESAYSNWSQSLPSGPRISAYSKRMPMHDTSGEKEKDINDRSAKERAIEEYNFKQNLLQKDKEEAALQLQEVERKAAEYEMKERATRLAGERARQESHTMKQGEELRQRALQRRVNMAFHEERMRNWEQEAKHQSETAPSQPSPTSPKHNVELTGDRLADEEPRVEDYLQQDDDVEPEYKPWSTFLEEEAKAAETETDAERLAKSTKLREAMFNAYREKVFHIQRESFKPATHAEEVVDEEDDDDDDENDDDDEDGEDVDDDEGSVEGNVSEIAQLGDSTDDLTDWNRFADRKVRNTFAEQTARSALQTSADVRRAPSQDRDRAPAPVKHKATPAPASRSRFGGNIFNTNSRRKR